MSLAELTRETFASRVGESFRVDLEGLTLELTLREVRALGAGDGEREPFSLLFVGPEPLLPQRIYPLEHPVLGRLEIFLVPLGPAADGLHYEAVFT